MLLGGGATLLALVQRLCDVLLYIEPGSGFYGGGSVPLRLGLLLVCAAVYIICCLQFASPGLAEYKKIPGAGILFALCCLFSVSLSAMQALAEVLLAPSFAVGVVSALCSLAGLLAAWWYYTAAISCFTGKQEGSDLLPAAAILWYCLRALNIFVREPVNARDSITIALLLSAITLASAYLSLARRKPSFSSAATLSCIACAGFSLPCAVWFLREGDAFHAAQLLGDALGAAALFIVAGSYAQPIERKTHEQKMD